MSHHVVEVVHASGKSAHEMFSTLADHSQLRRVFRVPVRRIRDGQGDVNGVGSVRSIGVGLLRLEETVTAMVPDRAIEYRITRGGGPVRNHAGRVELSDAGRGCRVKWTIEFDAPPLVGPALVLVLGRVLRRGLGRID
jgi:hypothetical protein